jgi:hypothetical protein
MNNQITWLKSTLTEVSLATLTTVHSQLFGLSAAVKLNTRQCPRLGYMSEVWVFTVYKRKTKKGERKRKKGEKEKKCEVKRVT